MKLFPVAAATAWTICRMSASLKLGVMLMPCCAACCAWQTSGGTSRARQHANTRKPFTNLNPRVGPALLHALRRRERLGDRRRHRRSGCSILRPGERFRLLFDSGQIESEILLPSIAQNRDVGLTRGAERPQNLLSPRRIVERRAVDRRDEIAGLQPQADERLLVASRIHPKTLLLAAYEHRLRAHDVADDARIAAHELLHALHEGSLGRGSRQARRRRAAGELARQGQRFDAAVTLEQHVVGVHGVQPRAARNVVSDFVYLGGRGARPEYCEPTAAITPVRTSGMLVCGALALPTAGVGATPKRWVLVIAAMSAGARRTREAAAIMPGAGALPTPARSVTIIAACTPSASASSQVATRGPRVKNRARHFSTPGTAWSQEAALIEVATSWIRPANHTAH